jgi:hypothetical protein
MTLENFKKELDKINLEIIDCYREGEIMPIYDGCLNPDSYYKSPLKILWLMKEPYDEYDGLGDWSLPDFFMKEYDKFFQGLILKTPTWRTVVHTTYCIFENFSNYDSTKSINSNPSMANYLNNIAWVNIQKLPSKTGSRTKIENIRFAYVKHKEIINKQIDLINPQIIICGNNFDIIKTSLGNPQEKKLSNSYCEYYEVKNRLYINAYHPAQSTVSRESYVNGIVNTIKKYLSNYN